VCYSLGVVMGEGRDDHTLTVTDVLGQERTWLVIVSRCWGEELGRLEGEEEFRIVMVEEPLSEDLRLSGPVAVCAPVSPLASGVREGRPRWGARPHQRPLGRTRAFAPFPLRAGHRHLASGEGVPQVEARALLLAWDHRQWWEAVEAKVREALSPVLERLQAREAVGRKEAEAAAKQVAAVLRILPEDVP